MTADGILIEKKGEEEDIRARDDIRKELYHRFYVDLRKRQAAIQHSYEDVKARYLQHFNGQNKEDQSIQKKVSGQHKQQGHSQNKSKSLVHQRSCPERIPFQGRPAIEGEAEFGVVPRTWPEWFALKQRELQLTYFYMYEPIEKVFIHCLLLSLLILSIYYYLR
jgi:hypothetical protein